MSAPDTGIPLVGRDEILLQMVRNLSRGHHTLLVGQKGVGKSRLLAEARLCFMGEGRHIAMGRVNSGRRILMIWHSSPLGECLRQLCEKIHAAGGLALDPPAAQGEPWPVVRKRLIGLGPSKVQDLVIESIARDERGYMVFFDSWDRITPAHHAFLERLLSAATVCAAIVRTSDDYHFKKVWSSFVRLDVKPLERTEAEVLARLAMERHAVRALEREFYVREVLKAAAGNPFRILTLVQHGSREGMVDREQIRGLRREDDGDFFNMGPIYIFGAGTFTLVKIFSMGLDNRESYIFFSALGFLVYFVFRVFRNFFLFRPQKSR